MEQSLTSNNHASLKCNKKKNGCHARYLGSLKKIHKQKLSEQNTAPSLRVRPCLQCRPTKHASPYPWSSGATKTHNHTLLCNQLFQSCDESLWSMTNPIDDKWWTCHAHTVSMGQDRRVSLGSSSTTACGQWTVSRPTQENTQEDRPSHNQLSGRGGSGWVWNSLMPKSNCQRPVRFESWKIRHCNCTWELKHKISYSTSVKLWLLQIPCLSTQLHHME